MATIRVQTTQNVTLEYETASVGDRLLATLIDYALYFVWAIFCTVIGDRLKAAAGNVGFSMLVLLPTTFYVLLCEVAFNGQTLGKKARDLRVVRLDGTRPGLGDYLLRWLLRPLEIVFCLGGIAILTILLNGRGQRLGDMAAGTTVISLRRAADHQQALATELPPAGYQVVYAQVALLSDHDVALIRQLLYQSTKKENYLLLNDVANKVKSITGIYSELRDEVFLRTVLRDHAHLSANA